jgi:hypothetical protein
MSPHLRRCIGWPVAAAIPLILLAACSNGTQPENAARPPEPASPPSTSPVATPVAPPSPAATPGVRKPRAIPAANVTGQFCLVRKVLTDPSNPVELRLPIAAVRSDEWATMEDVELIKYQPQTNCKKSTFDPTGYKLKIAARTDGRFDVTVRSGPSEQDLALSQTFVLSQQGAFMSASSEICTANNSDCGKFDGLNAYIYLTDIRNKEGDLAKLVMIDFFDPTEDPVCMAEQPLETATVIKIETNVVCDLPDWPKTTFGDPNDMNLRATPLSGFTTMQTGSGGGYEPPP